MTNRNVPVVTPQLSRGMGILTPGKDSSLQKSDDLLEDGIHPEMTCSGEKEDESEEETGP